MAWNKFLVDLPKGLSKDDRDAIAQDIIIYIQERAINEHKGFNPDTGREKTFPKYTKEYAKAKGVGRSDVDLTVTADMLNSMVIFANRPGALSIGVDPGDGKAEGNIKGSYGGEDNPSKARNFLGIPVKVLKEITDRYKSDS